MGKTSLIAFCILSFIGEVFSSNEERKLITRLFSHYDKRVRPSSEPNQPVQMNIERIHLKRFTHIDEENETVDIGFWTGLAWNDSLLSWNPSAYGGVKHISVRAEEIWTPDLTVLSGWGVPEQSLRESKEIDVMIMASGLVYYYPHVKLILPCLNITAAGDLECSFGLGSWSMGSDEMHVNLVQKTFDTDEFIMDPKYSIQRTSLEHMEIHVPAWDETTWELIVGRIGLKKK